MTGRQRSRGRWLVQQTALKLKHEEGGKIHSFNSGCAISSATETTGCVQRDSGTRDGICNTLATLAAFVWRCDVIGLQKGCRPWIETQRGRNTGPANNVDTDQVWRGKQGRRRRQKSGNRTDEAAAGQVRRSSAQQEHKKNAEQKLENTYNIKQRGRNVTYSET